MASADSFLDAPEGTREELMRATYLALCEHGYADLTVQRIGEAFTKSKSLIYHHYDGKDDLLLDFLAFVLDRFEEAVPFDRADPGSDELAVATARADADDAEAHLQAVLDHVFATPLPDERREFAKAMVELRAQAAHDERYRNHFTRHDRFFRDRIAAIIDSGIDAGVFADVEAADVATFLVTTINGSMTERVTSDGDTAGTVRDQVERYVRAVLREETAE